MSLGRHTLYNLAGAVLPMGIALLTVPLYLRYIGAERYGVLAVIWALLGYFSFFDLGLGRAVAQRMARLSASGEPERSKLLWTALLTTFFMGLVASVPLWLFSYYFLLKIIDMSTQSRLEASAAVPWILLCLPVLLPTTVMQGALQARLRFADANIIQIVGGIFGQLLPLAVAASGQIELKTLIPAVLASRVLVAILLFRQSRRYVPLMGSPRISREHLKAMLSYGGWVSVMTLLSPLLVTVDRLLIAAIGGAASVASYTVPYDLVTRTMVISGSLSSALFPRLASATAADARDMADRATVGLVALMTPVVIVGTFIAQPFLNIWVGRSFAETSAGVPELLLLGVWFNALVIPHQARRMAAGDPRIVVIIYLFEIPVYIFILWVGLRYWGVGGAAAAWSLRVLIDTSLLLYINDALSTTLRLAAPYFGLVVVATFSVLVAKLQPMAYCCLVFILVGLSLLKDRAQLAHAIDALRLHKAVS